LAGSPVDGLGAALVNGTVIRVTSIADMLSIAPYADTQISVANYHGDFAGGGGVFYWESTKDKANHNGGSVIDPGVTYPTDWTNQTQLATWFAAGTGNGCWIRQFTGAADVTMFGAKGDETTNNTLSFNNCKAAHSIVTAPAGGFLLTGLAFNESNASFVGAGYQRTRLLIDPSVTSGTFLAVASSSYLTGLRLGGFSIVGNNDNNVASPLDTVVGMSVGSTVSISATRNVFEEIYIIKVKTGLRAAYAWTNVWKHLSAGNCFLGFDLAVQVNNADFADCRMVNCRTHADINNCEGVLMTNPLFQNTSLLAGNGYALTMFQSNVTLINPYFENTAPDGLAEVGNPSEASTAPSMLRIIGGEQNGPSGFILKRGSTSAVVVEGLREGAGIEVVLGTDVALDKTSSDGRSGFSTTSRLKPFGANVPETEALLWSFQNNNKETLVKAGGGGVLTVNPTNNNAVNISVSSAFVGFDIPYTCDDGELYTIAIRALRDSDNFISIDVGRGVDIKDLVSVDGIYRTFYIPFRMNGTAKPFVRLSTAASILSLQQLDLYAGCVIQETESEKSSQYYHTVAPTVGTWNIGDIVYSKAPAASGSIGWVCTVAGTPGTWKTFGVIAA